MGEIHLDHEATNLGFEDGMHDVLFAKKYLLHRPDFATRDHIQVAVIDWRPDCCTGLIVIRNEGEVEPARASGIQVIGALLGSGDRGAQTIDLAIVLLQLLLGDGQSNVELRDIRAEFGLLFNYLERLGSVRGLIEDVVREENFRDPAIRVGVAGLVDCGNLGCGVALSHQPGGKVLTNAGFELLQLSEDRLGLGVVGLLLGVEFSELRASKSVVVALPHDCAAYLGDKSLKRGALSGHLGQGALLVDCIHLDIFDRLLAGHELREIVETLFVGGGDDHWRGPGGVDRIEAHDEGIRENPGEDAVEGDHGEDTVDGENRLVDK